MIKIEDISAEIRLGMLDFGQFSAENLTVSKRDMEQKGVQFLMREMLKTNTFNIVYNEANRPFLEGRQEQISISHSHNWLVIAIHQKSEIGVDIELIRDKVVNIKHKFLTDSELDRAGSNMEMLTLLWAAKEAIYKAHGKKEVEFKNIIVDAFKMSDTGELLGTLNAKTVVRKFILMYKKIDNYILALVTDEVEL